MMREQRWSRLSTSLGEDLRWLEAVGVLAAEQGVRVALVGGAVRDLVLGRDVMDLDLVVEGDAPRIAKGCADRFGGRVQAHETFGTATWTRQALKIDFAMARTETYSAPAALPVVRAGTLEEDLRRRDFSVNALALLLSPGCKGELVDPFGGERDLGTGTLSVLHNQSFDDDPTRGLRAARFAARFGFTLGDKSRQLLSASIAAGSVDKLTPERMGAELTRVLEEPRVGSAVACMRQWGLLAALHPSLAADVQLEGRLDKGRTSWEQYKGAERGSVSDVLWALLGLSMTRAEREQQTRWHGGTRGGGQHFVEAPARIERAREALADQTSPEVWGDALMGLRPDECVALSALANPGMCRALDWWSETGSAVVPEWDGEALIAAGYAPGPALGAALAAIRRVAWSSGNKEEQLQAGAAAYARALDCDD